MVRAKPSPMPGAIALDGELASQRAIPLPPQNSTLVTLPTNNFYSKHFLGKTFAPHVHTLIVVTAKHENNSF
jgi:hypothetical protein